jgi:ATP-dependent RNA helicase SUPV3L1/SUV3
MNLIQQAPLRSVVRARDVTAVLGPTNTGKTHLAIERMLGHESGAIGLPLRLLAREVYGRVAARAGVSQVALVTGEEKLIPPRPRYWISTVEAMPRDLNVAFVAIDEVQLAGDLERGHVFTDRLLNVRGTQETMLLGSATARPLIERLLPGVHVVSRPRMSQLVYAGGRKITRLPRRTAVVAFSAEEVYAVAELIRRQRGGAAVVMGALSPRTRNAQVALFQNGDVEFLVATDAIGMGLNLDVDNVAFAQARKFDGYQYRNLTPAEMGQIAGRAGRYLNDGTFGVTGQVGPLDDDLVRAIESHDFEPVKTFQWRNADLSFDSVAALRASLDRLPAVDGLARALPADDIRAFEYVLRDPDAADRAGGRDEVRLLWDVCQVPDFRKISPAQHGDLVVALYRFLTARGRVPDDWFARQVAFCDRVDGDIDALSARLAEIRTWTFVANRGQWLDEPMHWQERTRDIEDRLSDALHDRLTQRFVDRRTSVLMKRLRENTMLDAEITGTGAVLVEGQHVGELHGFRFVPDQSTSADTPDGKAIRAAAAKALAGEFEKRAERISRAGNEEIVLSSDYALRWLGQPVARIVAGEDTLSPRVTLLADEQLTGAFRDKVQARLDLWLFAHVTTLLKPLFDLRNATDVEGIARGVAFRLVEALGTLERQEVADEVKSLDQGARAVLRKYGVRFGAYHIYLPALLKPAPATLVAQLWALKAGATDRPGLSELPQLSASGRTSIKVDPTIDRTLYRLVGFRVAGERAVRLDILERLADIIRPLIAWKPVGGATPPDGAIPQGGGFTVTVAMTSLLGCSGEDFSSILKALGYRMEKRVIRVPVAAPAEAAPPGEPASAPAVAEVVETAASAEPGTAGSDIIDEAGAGETANGPAETVAEPVAETVQVDADAAPEAATEPVGDVAEAETPEPVSPEAGAPKPVSAEGEATAEAAPAAVIGETPVATEEKEVEIWRPGRFDRGRRPEHRGGQHPHRGGERQREGGQAERRGPPGEGDRRRHDRPGLDQARGKDRPAGGDRPRSERRPERRDEGRDERRDDRRPNRDGDRGPRRERPVDPNSPFAALLALKADLEQKQKK